MSTDSKKRKKKKHAQKPPVSKRRRVEEKRVVYGSGEALMLIGMDPATGVWIVGDRAAKVVSSFKGRVSVVSVNGPFRSGKSTWMNEFVQARTGFGVGATVNACTKGIWIYSEPIERTGSDGLPVLVLVMDTEGSKSLTSNGVKDTDIFCMSVLLASVVVLNTTKAINSSSIEDLHYVAKMAETVRTRSGSTSELADSMPHFVWLLRDFGLELEDRSGNPINPDQYLDQALASSDNDNLALEKIRSSLRTLFPRRHCSVLPTPLLDEKHMKSTELFRQHMRPAFRAKMLESHQRVLDAAEPKRVSGKAINGSQFVKLARTFVEMFNEGTQPVLETAWESVSRAGAREAFDSCLFLWDKAVAEIGPGETDLSVVETALAKARANIDAHFHDTAFGDGEAKDACLAKLRDRFKKTGVVRMDQTKTALKAVVQARVNSVDMSACSSITQVRSKFRSLKSQCIKISPGHAEDVFLQVAMPMVWLWWSQLTSSQDTRIRELTKTARDSVTSADTLRSELDTSMSSEASLKVRLEQANTVAAKNVADAENRSSLLDTQNKDLGFSLKALREELAKTKNKHERENKASLSSFEDREKKWLTTQKDLETGAEAARAQVTRHQELIQTVTQRIADQERTAETETHALILQINSLKVKLSQAETAGDRASQRLTQMRSKLLETGAVGRELSAIQEDHARLQTKLETGDKEREDTEAQNKQNLESLHMRTDTLIKQKQSLFDRKNRALSAKIEKLTRENADREKRSSDEAAVLKKACEVSERKLAAVTLSEETLALRSERTIKTLQEESDKHEHECESIKLTLGGVVKSLTSKLEEATASASSQSEKHAKDLLENNLAFTTKTSKLNSRATCAEAELKNVTGRLEAAEAKAGGSDVSSEEVDTMKLEIATLRNDGEWFTGKNKELKKEVNKLRKETTLLEKRQRDARRQAEQDLSDVRLTLQTRITTLETQILDQAEAVVVGTKK
jgi:hypothetical protein